VVFKSVKNSLDGDGDDRVNLANQKPAIAYLKIDSIMASTPRELAAWEPRLRAAKVDGLILDLRGTGARESSDNAHAALLLANSLVDGKSLGKLRTRENTRELPAANRDCLFRDLPLAVLIDKYTDGPASWVAAILQDSDPPAQQRRRAVVVGLFGGGDNFTRTAVPLPWGDELILASGVWERPGAANASKRKVRMYSVVNPADRSSGWSIGDETAVAHRDGVVPDAFVSYYLETRDDVQNMTFDPPISTMSDPRARDPYKSNPAVEQSTPKASNHPDPIADVAIIELKQQLELAPKKS
jgi:hypothetical protein